MEAGSQLHPRPWHKKTPGLFAPFFPLTQLVAAMWSGLQSWVRTVTCPGNTHGDRLSAELRSAPAAVPTGALDTGTLRSDVPQSSYADQGTCSQDTLKAKGGDCPMTQADKPACCPGVGFPPHSDLTRITTNSPDTALAEPPGDPTPRNLSEGCTGEHWLFLCACVRNTRGTGMAQKV